MLKTEAVDHLDKEASRKITDILRGDQKTAISPKKTKIGGSHPWQVWAHRNALSGFFRYVGTNGFISRDQVRWSFQALNSLVGNLLQAPWPYFRGSFWTFLTVLVVLYGSICFLTRTDLYEGSSDAASKYLNPSNILFSFSWTIASVPQALQKISS